jgi:hypothetical protein
LFEVSVFFLLLLDMPPDRSPFLPTADTQYPRAQKCYPTKFLRRPAYTRAIRIALLPLIKPITLDTEYFDGTLRRMCL